MQNQFGNVNPDVDPTRINMMIQLRDLLAEITMGSIAPYATQFTWLHRGERGYETKVQCDGVTVVFGMELQYSPDGKEYAFAIAMPGGSGSGFTVSHRLSDVPGTLSYLRVLRTAGEAILDFCAQHSPDAIDLTGFDTDAEKDLQKTRIYRNLLHANAADIASAGYVIYDQTGKLYLIARRRYDATGIEDD